MFACNMFAASAERSLKVVMGVSLGVALLTTACVPAESLSDTGPGATPPDAAKPGPDTYVGMLRDSLAVIGLVVEEGRVAAYVCDGDDSGRSISQWFEAELDRDGSFEATVDGSAYYSAADQPYTLMGAIAGDLATGMLYVNKTPYAWDAERVSDPNSPAGVYVSEDEESVTSTVVLNEKFALGLRRVKGQRITQAVTTPATMPTKNDVRVTVGQKTAPITKLTRPADLSNINVKEWIDPASKPPIEERPTPKSEPTLEEHAKLIDRPIEVPGPQNAVQVKFRDGLRIRLDRTGRLYDENGKALNGKDAQVLLDQTYKNGRWNRSHALVSEETLDRWSAIATKQLGKNVADLNLYFNVQLDESLPAADMAKAFRELREVEYAWVMPTYYLANVGDLSEYQGAVNANGFQIEEPYQKYLDAAPVGVDARYAWLWNGGTGAGVNVVDIESGFDRNHEDLPAVIENDQFPFDPTTLTERQLNHGTSTLGVIAGVDNGFGVKGIAHDANVYFSPASYAATFGTQYVLGIDGFFTGTLISKDMQPGDVIVFEQQLAGPNVGESTISPQFGLVAVEWFKPNWDAIRMATANGFVVVQAAGNGHQDLDGNEYLTDPDAYHQPFRMNDATRVNDSGAIIVGAGYSGADWSPYSFSQPNTRHYYSNHGGRVDLHAWGDAVVTAGPGNPQTIPYYDGDNNDISDDYSSGYGGTSSATAIMGGVCTAFQGFYKEWSGGGTMTSQAMRDALRVDATPQSTIIPGNIGPMPNLRGAIEAIYNSGPPPVEDVPVIDDSCPGDPFYFDPSPYCGTNLPFPKPVFSLPNGVIDPNDPVDLYLSMEGGFSMSGTVFYTTDGSTPQNCLEVTGGLNCGTTQALTRNHLRFCSPLAIAPNNGPITIKALSTTALCSPRESSQVSTAVYVPPGYIKAPLFERPSNYDAGLSISMRTDYPSTYPDGFAFVCYTLDGSEPVYSSYAADGVGSPTWADWNDDFGHRIEIFANAAPGESVTLRARNYLYISGVFVPGEIVTWTFPAPQ